MQYPLGRFRLSSVLFDRYSKESLRQRNWPSIFYRTQQRLDHLAVIYCDCVKEFDKISVNKFTSICDRTDSGREIIV